MGVFCTIVRNYDDKKKNVEVVLNLKKGEG